jgi:hypothetical protein
MTAQEVRLRSNAISQFHNFTISIAYCHITTIAAMLPTNRYNINCLDCITISHMPRRASEHLSGTARKGCGRDAARCQRDRKSLQATPINARSAGSKRHPGRLFFGYFLLQKIAPAFSAFSTSMYFGEAKESIPSVGTRTRIQTIVALATHLFSHPCALDSGDPCRKDGF